MCSHHRSSFLPSGLSSVFLVVRLLGHLSHSPGSSRQPRSRPSPQTQATISRKPIHFNSIFFLKSLRSHLLPILCPSYTPFSPKTSLLHKTRPKCHLIWSSNPQQNLPEPQSLQRTLFYQHALVLTQLNTALSSLTVRQEENCHDSWLTLQAARPQQAHCGALEYAFKTSTASDLVQPSTNLDFLAWTPPNQCLGSRLHFLCA